MHTFKTLATILILTGTIIGFSIYTNNKINITSHELANEVELIEKLTYKGEWASAKEKVSQFRDKWSKTENSWLTLIEHFEIDNVNMSISKLSKHIDLKDKNFALVELYTLKELLEHFPEKESISIQNVF